ncbi:MAG: von Willebrand factor type A domain-containing protein [Planctomycetes bacterium]|nr:von Willebrand factor type A domain-containing protein [Planctomycetota bacterium]
MKGKSVILLFSFIVGTLIISGCGGYPTTGTMYNMDMSKRCMIQNNSGSRELEELPPETELNRDEFMEYKINEFKSVLEHPKSTFSTDVDTATYTFCKNQVGYETLPKSEQVRVEEFLNYFDYNYKAPEDEILTMYSELADNPFNNGKTAFLRLALKAKEITNEERRPAHLTFLIDVSGSMMATNKLELVKKSMKILVKYLKPGDTVGMCTYASGAKIVLEPTLDKDEIIDALDKLKAGGSTAGAAGLTNAYDLANDCFVEGEINRVIMCTDGDFNVGVTDHKELQEIINTKSQKGISLSIFGYGSGNLQDDMMKHIAKTGNGNYFYIGSKKDAQRVLGDKLASTIEIVASNTKIQIEFNPTLVDEYRLIGYEVRALKDEDFDNDLVDAGDIGPGHNVTAVYELRLHNVQTMEVEEPAEFAGKLGIFKIRYKHNITDSESHLLKYFIENERKSFASASPSFKFAAGVTGFADVLRDSKFAKDWKLTTAIDCIEAGSVVPESDGKELIKFIRKVISLKDKASVEEEVVTPE